MVGNLTMAAHAVHAHRIAVNVVAALNIVLLASMVCPIRRHPPVHHHMLKLYLDIGGGSSSIAIHRLVLSLRIGRLVRPLAEIGPG